MSAPSDSDHRPRGPRRFRPSLWPTLIAIPVLAVLVGLGTWQVQRLAWKTELIERIEARTEAAPVPLPAAIDDPAAWDYVPVTVTGAFLHDREMFLGPRTLVEGGVTRTGAHLLTPLRREDGTTVLVDRGWVPPDRQDAATRPGSQPQGVVTVEGLARLPGGRATLQPDNRPDDRFWFWYDLTAMADAAGVDAVLPVIVQAGPAENPGGYPVGGRTVLQITNNHLGYAVTWYGLALTLVGVWATASYRRTPD